MHPSSVSPNIEFKSKNDDHIGDINHAFAAFRETNDERMAQLERRMAGDVVTKESSPVLIALSTKQSVVSTIRSSRKAALAWV